MKSVGAVELGGSKIRVARGTPGGEIVASDTFATTSPGESFARILDFFGNGPGVAGIAVAAFGPVAVDPRDIDYGRLRATPKTGWSGFDIMAALRPLGVPVALDTDVNAAGRAEAALGALVGHDSGAYLTVGTGIGGALIIDGAPAPGASHAEMGHVALVRVPDDDAPSVCPFHASCAEGLASGPAIVRRYGADLSALPGAHPAHELTAAYLGQMVASLVLIAAPRRIVIGGGVVEARGLHERVRDALVRQMNGYALYREMELPDFVVPPGLGADAGLTGALLLAPLPARIGT